MSLVGVPPEPWPEAPPLGGGGAASAASGRGGVSLGSSISIMSTPSAIAKEALLEFLELSNCDLRKVPDNLSVCKDFVEWLDLTEQKGFVAKGYDTKKKKFLRCPFQYLNRWSSVRRDELSRKLDQLEFWFEEQQDRPVTLITLTSYHTGFSVQAAWYKLNQSREKLLKLIAKYFDSPDYFWVVEPHENGYVHYHLVVFAAVDNETKDNRGRGIEDKFRDLWSREYQTGSHTYGLDFTQKMDDGKLTHLKWYLEKYLRKGFLLDSWSPGMLVFNAHLWDTGFRLYGASKNIRAIMNIGSEKQSHVVWLETKIEDVLKDSEGEYYEEEWVVWYRQYIPDWLDSPMWVNEIGTARNIEPEKLYIYDWGRRYKDYDMMRYGEVIHVGPKPKTRRIQIAGGEWIEVPDVH